MSRVIAIGAGLTMFVAPGLGTAAGAAPPPPMPPDLVARATNVTTYPAFCEIPATPTHLRTAESYRALVVETRLAGARVVRRTAPGTFVLADTEGFAAGVRAAAAPPPPMSSPAADNIDDFLKSARARALPPGRR